MVDVLCQAGLTTVDHAAILGAGGTARAALAAVQHLGAARVTVYARRPEAVSALRPVAEHLGLRLAHASFDTAAQCGRAELVISTVPSGVADDLAVRWQPATVLFDAIYDPWPTPLAASAAAAGCRIASGLDLLLAQAARQFVLFTGVPAPVDHMRDALYAAAAAR